MRGHEKMNESLFERTRYSRVLNSHSSSNPTSDDSCAEVRSGFTRTMKCIHNQPPCLVSSSVTHSESTRIVEHNAHYDSVSFPLGLSVSSDISADAPTEPAPGHDRPPSSSGQEIPPAALPGRNTPLVAFSSNTEGAESAMWRLDFPALHFAVHLSLQEETESVGIKRTNHSQGLSVGSPPCRRVVRKIRAVRKALRGAPERPGEGVPRQRRRSYLSVSVKTEKHKLALNKWPFPPEPRINEHDAVRSGLDRARQIGDPDVIRDERLLTDSDK
ncbi:unnamed protein product [Pleuronectes platessa]|uniref:Uncharacterized protein n=1 Tax=Pleuronectes platessa TaxID=8262 RepID=A0A9N7YHA7_PLEPL|nr:unnamed protein product [Pleuronectes platessa]